MRSASIPKKNAPQWRPTILRSGDLPSALAKRGHPKGVGLTPARFARAEAVH